MDKIVITLWIVLLTAACTIRPPEGPTHWHDCREMGCIR